ncbi:hypothetical protein SAY86_004481 [Trapa natans]|uniref:Uncharacterized protein n=1 Tax=Trapa natans TaxID=22666 RepID=A0AAN7RFM4_TRANT|nr:hypothetical protein SAY86_004481 [Trapa natans]
MVSMGATKAPSGFQELDNHSLPVKPEISTGFFLTQHNRIAKPTILSSHLGDVYYDVFTRNCGLTALHLFRMRYMEKQRTKLL